MFYGDIRHISTIYLLYINNTDMKTGKTTLRLLLTLSLLALYGCADELGTVSPAPAQEEAKAETVGGHGEIIDPD